MFCSHLLAPRAGARAGQRAGGAVRRTRARVRYAPTYASPLRPLGEPGLALPVRPASPCLPLMQPALGTFLSLAGTGPLVFAFLFAAFTRTESPLPFFPGGCRPSCQAGVQRVLFLCRSNHELCAAPSTAALPANALLNLTTWPNLFACPRLPALQGPRSSSGLP